MFEQDRVKPRFHPDEILPDVPPGQILVKFHHHPALLPVRLEGEPLYKGSFTKRQFNELILLEKIRLATQRGLPVIVAGGMEDGFSLN